MVCEAIHFVGYAFGAIATALGSAYTMKLRKKVAEEQVRTERRKSKWYEERRKTEKVRRFRMVYDVGTDFWDRLTGRSKKKPN